MIDNDHIIKSETATIHFIAGKVAEPYASMLRDCADRIWDVRLAQSRVAA